MPEAISKPLPWFLGLAQGIWELLNKCQSLKKVKESITPHSVMSSGSVGPGSMATTQWVHQGGAHPTFPGRGREDRGHWGSPSPGCLHLPGERSSLWQGHGNAGLPRAAEPMCGQGRAVGAGHIPCWDRAWWPGGLRGSSEPWGEGISQLGRAKQPRSSPKDTTH